MVKNVVDFLRCCQFLQKVGALAFMLVLVLPVVNENLEPVVEKLQPGRAPDPQMMSFIKTFLSATFVGVPCVTMIYPFIVLCIMLTPSVAKAFRTDERESSREQVNDDDFGDFDRERSFDRE